MSRSQKPRKPTAREQIISALLSGKHIIAAEFGRHIGTSATTVTHTLKSLGTLVHRVTKFEGPGKHCCEYSAANLDGLQAELERNVYAREGSGRRRLRFDELMEAWGMTTKPARIKLPSFQHRMADNDDEREAA